MKEHPILFNGEMVRAILERRKTQTRRVLKGQPLEILPKCPGEWVGLMSRDPNRGKIFKCRYGNPGGLLWVRETWQAHRLDGPLGPEFPNILYRADSSTRLILDERVWKYVRDKPQWRPSIHMPRWASRITLELTGVRIERVQDINEEDAIAEGVFWSAPQPFGERWDEEDREDPMQVGYPPANSSFARPNFRRLWDSINAKRGFGWDANPWVWVLEFERTTP